MKLNQEWLRFKKKAWKNTKLFQGKKGLLIVILVKKRLLFSFFWLLKTKLKYTLQNNFPIFHERVEAFRLSQEIIQFSLYIFSIKRIRNINKLFYSLFTIRLEFIKFSDFIFLLIKILLLTLITADCRNTILNHFINL